MQTAAGLGDGRSEERRDTRRRGTRVGEKRNRRGELARCKNRRRKQNGRRGALARRCGSTAIVLRGVIRRMLIRRMPIRGVAVREGVRGPVMGGCAGRRVIRAVLGRSR